MIFLPFNKRRMPLHVSLIILKMYLEVLKIKYVLMLKERGWFAISAVKTVKGCSSVKVFVWCCILILYIILLTLISFIFERNIIISIYNPSRLQGSLLQLFLWLAMYIRVYEYRIGITDFFSSYITDTKRLINFKFCIKEYSHRHTL